jgi:hypothetical protein
LTIKGNSPDESAVTQFGRSLEFSGGLFTNLNIETQRKESPNATPTATNTEAPAEKPIVGFTIRCAYTPSKASASQNTMPTTAANAPQQPNAGPAQSVKAQTQAAAPQSDNPAPPQVAKNQ